MWRLFFGISPDGRTALIVSSSIALEVGTGTIAARHFDRSQSTRRCEVAHTQHPNPFTSKSWTRPACDLGEEGTVPPATKNPAEKPTSASAPPPRPCPSDHILTTTATDVSGDTASVRGPP